MRLTAGGNIRDRTGVGRGVRAHRRRADPGAAGRGVVTAESSGGAIQVNTANGVQLRFVRRRDSFAQCRGALRASTSAGSILAELLSGTRIEDSTLSTNAGDITVFIASNLPLTVLARNQSSGDAGRIISDFPEIQVRNVAQPGVSPVVAEGALNGGGPVLHINVVGGTIYLRRQK